MSRSNLQLQAIRDSVAWVGQMSDGLVKVGPLSLGLDGVLAWIPGLGEVYSLAAGGFILVQGARAGVAPTTLIIAAGLLAVRSVAAAVPVAGSAVADLFTAHKWAAAMIVRAIDARLAGYMPTVGSSISDGFGRRASSPSPGAA